MSVQPPHNLTIERHVLGAMLLNAEVVPLLRSRLAADEFYDESHQQIFSALLAAYGEHGTTDHEVVYDRLCRAGQGVDYSYLVRLLSETPSSLAADAYATVLKHHAWRRRCLSLAGDMARWCHSEAVPVKEIHARLLDGLNGLSGAVLHHPRTARDLASAQIDEIHEAGRQQSAARGWSTGFSMLDQLLADTHRPGTFSVFGGYTNQGKTQIAVEMAMAAARQGPSLYVTLESTPEVIWNRMVAVEARVPASLVAGRYLTDPRQLTAVTEANSRLSDLSLEIETFDRLPELEAYLQDMSVRYDFAPGLVFIDDIDSLAEQMRGANEYEKLKRVSVGLATMVLRTGWGVVALKQLRMPSQAVQGVTNSDKLLKELTPTIGSFEGGRTIAQKGGNVITMLSADWIRAKVYDGFHHDALQDGHVYFRKLKARDARSDRVLEVPLRFDPAIPRYVDVPVQREPL